MWFSLSLLWPPCLTGYIPLLTLSCLLIGLISYIFSLYVIFQCHSLFLFEWLLCWHTKPMIRIWSPLMGLIFTIFLPFPICDMFIFVIPLNNPEIPSVFIKIYSWTHSVKILFLFMTDRSNQIFYKSFFFFFHRVYEAALPFLPEFYANTPL